MNFGPLVTVEGLVMPIEWDENGCPIRVKICASGEVDYIVEHTQESYVLYKYLKNLVRVRGFVGNNGTCRVLRVRTVE